MNAMADPDARQSNALTADEESLPTSEPVGLIAGNGRLPILAAEGLRRAGRRVHAIGLAGQYEPDLPGLCDRFARVGLFRLGQWSRRLRRMGVSRAVMIGGVDKARLMHDPLRLVRRMPDGRTAMVWYRRLRRDKRSAEVLRAVAEELERGGVRLVDSTSPLRDHLVETGALTTRQPTQSQRDDIAFAWPVFQKALILGIGQSMAVREKDIIAVEASEGTDAMIRRAGELCRRGGWTLLKGAGPTHDRRADVPTIGEATIRAMREAGGTAIALESGGVIIVDKPKVLSLAERLGVAVVGIDANADAEQSEGSDDR